MTNARQMMWLMATFDTVGKPLLPLIVFVC
jgi:hypothetical protein